MTAVRLVVDAIAAYRLTRLVTADSIAQPIRDQVVRTSYAWADRPLPEQEPGLELAVAAMDDPEHPKWAELASCRWCAGMWVSLGIVLVARRFRWWPTMADALALSAVAALAARLED